MKQNEERIASKYAQAVYNQLGDQLSEELCEQLLLLADALEAKRSVILLSYVARRDDSMLEGLFEDAGYGSLFGPLVSLLREHRRLRLLPQVLRTVRDLYLEDNGIMHFIIESPVELTKKEQDGFVSFLQKKTGKEIRYTLKSNPELIAGIKMYSKTLGYEHSLQQKLYQL